MAAYAAYEVPVPGRSSAAGWPARTRPQLRLEDQKRTVLNTLEWANLLAAARATGTIEHCLVALLGMSGLRIAEACSLDITDIGAGGRYDTIRFIGKGNKPAHVPLPPPVARAVRACVGTRDIGPLLTSRTGHRMDRSCAGRMLKRLAATAHITTEFSPHSLRRTFATTGLLNGVPLRDVQLAMRYKDANTTTRYDMRSNNYDRHAAHRIVSQLSGRAG